MPPFSIVLGTVCFAIFVWVLFMFWIDGPEYMKKTNNRCGIAALVLAIIWLFSDGAEMDIVNSYTKKTEKILVSASPSKTQINGHISGFIFLSGVINEKRYYLLREEVQPRLYKDFEVTNEVYIREDDNLTDKGKFTQVFKCEVTQWRYDILGYTAYKYKPKTNCNYIRQEIAVPTGYVIKDLSI